MTLYDIEKLMRDPNQENLYNLFDPTFKMNTGFKLTKHIVSPEQEMRIDLISEELYGTVDQADFLLDINDIDLPLNIKAGDEIIYPEFTSISEYRINVVDNAEARSKLLNASKTTRLDDNRKRYIEENYSLPPTFLETPEAPVKIESNQIIIGG